MDNGDRDRGRLGRLPLMDGLRGIAALLVMTRHTDEFWPLVPYRSHLAVDLFFLLSGFVLSRAYGTRLRSGELSTGRFMAIRLVRLYPMFLLSALLSGALFLGGILRHGHLDLDDVLAVAFTLAMLPFSLPGSLLLFPLEAPYWSLFFEVIVNSLYARVLRRLGAGAMLAFAGVAAAVLVGVSLSHGGLDVGFRWSPMQISAGLSRAVFGIFLGALLERHASTWRLTRLLRAHPWIALAAMVAVMVSPSLGRLNGAADAVAVLLVLPVCVLGLDVPVANPVAARGLMLLGSASYPLYVLHVPMDGFVLREFAPAVHAHPLAAGIAFTVALVALCVVLERGVDEPVRRWLQRRIAGLGRPPAGAAGLPAASPVVLAPDRTVA